MDLEDRSISRLKTILRFGFLSALVLLFVQYLATHIEDFRSLDLVKPGNLIVLCFLFLVQYALIGWITKLLVEAFGFPLSHFEAFGTALLTGFYNLITPIRGGIAARGLYLKTKHDFPYTKFAATFSARYILFYFAAAIIGGSTLLLSRGTQIQQFSILLWSFAAVLFAFGILIVFSPQINGTREGILVYMGRVLNGWYSLRVNKRLVATIFLLSISEILVAGLDLQLRYAMFDLSLNYVQALLLSSINTVSLLISFTPAGLGITEAVNIFSGQLIEIPIPVALTVSLTQRAISSLLLLTLGPLSSYLLYREPATRAKQTPRKQKTE